MRKWTRPYSDVALPPRLDPVEGEKVKSARAFRFWLAAGAEPGGLRALAGERSPRRADARRAPCRRTSLRRDFRRHLAGLG